MKLTLLGCGNSTGVPIIQCKCKVCLSINPKNRRLRCSAWIEVNNKSFLIDTSPDLRQQALRADIQKIDAVLYTHPHADHIQGIDELRCYNFIQNHKIQAFGNSWTCQELKSKFSYIFSSKKVEGGGVPQINLNLIDTSTPFFIAADESIIPIKLFHGSKESVGYRIGSIAYLTDCSKIPTESKERLQGLSVLILDCLKLEKHPTHFNLEQALETIEELKPKTTYLTHLSHELDYEEDSKKLPKGVSFAYDGLVVNE